MRKIFVCVCVCIIKLHCHFLPDLAPILNKAMNSKGAASKPVPGADFIQLLILRHLFVSHIRTDSIYHAHTTSSMRNHHAHTTSSMRNQCYYTSFASQ